MIMISPFLFSSLRKNIFFIIIYFALASPFYAQTSRESLKLMQEYEKSQKRKYALYYHIVATAFHDLSNRPVTGSAITQT